MLQRSLSQPDRVVPTKSNTPIAANKLAPCTSGMPWSTQAGIRCVPINPLVDAPHTKKLPASSQKSRERSPSRSARIAVVAGLPWLEMAGGAPGSDP